VLKKKAFHLFIVYINKEASFFFLKILFKLFFFWWLFMLFLDWPSWLGYVRLISLQFNFKPELYKKLNRKVFFIISFVLFSSSQFLLHIIFYQLVELFLNKPSRMGYVEITSTWFSFKLELDKKILRMKCFFSINFIIFF
jgi:hypothetical protein